MKTLVLDTTTDLDLNKEMGKYHPKQTIPKQEIKSETTDQSFNLYQQLSIL